LRALFFPQGDATVKLLLAQIRELETKIDSADKKKRSK